MTPAQILAGKLYLNGILEDPDVPDSDRVCLDCTTRWTPAHWEYPDICSHCHSSNYREMAYYRHKWKDAQWKPVCATGLMFDRRTLYE
jgi:hypothetical protein